MNQHLKLGAVLAGGVLAMSSASIFIRWAQADHVPSLVIAAYRLSIATCALSIPVIGQRAWRDYARLDRRAVAMLLLSGVLLGLHFAAWITSLANTSVISSVVLVSTTPLWVGMMAPLLLGERTPHLMWLGIVAAIGGAAIIGLASLKESPHRVLWGDLLAVTGAWFATGYLIIGRRLRSRIPLVPYLWLVYGTAAAFLLAWSLLSRLPLTGYPASAVLWMVALGLVPQLIGHSAANYAIRHLSATFVSVTILGEPIGSTLLAVFLLNEWPSPLQLTGGMLILGGIMVALLAENRATAIADTMRG